MFSASLFIVGGCRPLLLALPIARHFFEHASYVTAYDGDAPVRYRVIIDQPCGKGVE